MKVMAHKTRFKEAYPMFRIADDEISQTIPVVVYSPKYDESWV